MLGHDREAVLRRAQFEEEERHLKRGVGVSSYVCNQPGMYSLLCGYFVELLLRLVLGYLTCSRLLAISIVAYETHAFRLELTLTCIL